jgi:hypothetical protein
MLMPRLTVLLFAALGLPLSGNAQTVNPLALLTEPVDFPMLSYTTIGRLNAIAPADVFEIDISESGGITDIFIRLSAPATAELAQWTELAEGYAMTVSICGAEVLQIYSVESNTSGTLYIPNLTFVQADALRTVWHGRATCASLPPDVFSVAP